METNEHGQPVGDPVPGWAARRRPERRQLSGRFTRLEPLSPGRHEDSLWRTFCEDSAGRIWTYLSFGPFHDQAAFSAWLEEIAQSEDPLFYAVVRRDLDAAVGLVSYLRIEPIAGSVEVGALTFSPLLQRTPAATEAMALMMRYAFDDLGYRRYEWKCDSLNAPSRRAATRLGFVFEGVFRQATVVKGRNRDTAWYSVIDEEWPLVRTAHETWLAEENFDSAGNQRRSLSELTAALH